MTHNENGFLFLGSGSSSSIPNISHLPGKNVTNVKKRELTEEELNEINQYIDKLVEGGGTEKVDELLNIYLKKAYKNEKDISCYTCLDALSENSKNRRNNISLLLKSNKSYVLIDCGKTFRASVLANQSKLDFKSNTLELILISHSHADAVNGMDDLRDIQQFEKIKMEERLYYVPKNIIKMYMNEFCYTHLCQCFKYMTKDRFHYYLTKVPVIDYYVLSEKKYNEIYAYDNKMLNNNCENETKDSEDKINNMKQTSKEVIIDREEQMLEINENNDIIKRLNIIRNLEKSVTGKYLKTNNKFIYSVKDEYGFIYTKFDKCIKIRFISFEHGKNYTCIGYIIGNNNKIVYISDCSNVSDFTLSYIKKFSPISVLIIDALYAKRTHFSHFSLVQSIDFALKVKPLKVYFIGMCCEVEHNITNMFLKKISEKFYPDISFELAHDGLFVPFNF